jgi:hypothetical protein
LIGIFGAADFGIKNPVTAVALYANADKIRRSNFADLLVD